MSGKSRILIVGRGHGGMHTVLRLERLLRPDEAMVMVADPRSHMTCQPLVAEAAAGDLEPRHVVVPSSARQDFKAVLRVIAAGPPRLTPFPCEEEKEADHHADQG